MKQQLKLLLVARQRVKYGLDYFLDYFLGYFLNHFMDQIFFGPFYRGGSTPLVLREGWDAVYQYRGRGGRKYRKFKISRLQS